jgi:hypothetical protein
VDNFTIINVAAARLGAACLGVRSPWTNVAAAGVNHALGQGVLVAGTPGVRRHAAVRPVQAMSVQQTTQLPWFAVGTATEPLPTTITVNRKPKNAPKTRINAGGYGAMGPHPERERLA